MIKTLIFAAALAVSTTANAQNFEWKGTRCQTTDSCTDRRFNNYFNQSQRMRNEFQNRIHGRNSYRWDREAGKASVANEVHRVNRGVRINRTGGGRAGYKWNRTH